jgi:hypothetical protein
MYFVLYKPLESRRIPFVGEGPPSSLLRFESPPRALERGVVPHRRTYPDSKNEVTLLPGGTGGELLFSLTFSVDAQSRDGLRHKCDVLQATHLPPGYFVAHPGALLQGYGGYQGYRLPASVTTGRSLCCGAGGATRDGRNQCLYYGGAGS